MKPREWNSDNLIKAVERSRSLRQVLATLGLQPAGGNYIQIKKYIEEKKLDTSHFLGRGWNIEGKNLAHSKTDLNDILIENSNYQSSKLKKRLFITQLKKMACERCGWSKLAPDGRIPLELHHKNGNRYDNRLGNLEILCPNCHSLEPTHRGLNSKRQP